jgi:hypothetical protein
MLILHRIASELCVNLSHENLEHFQKLMSRNKCKYEPSLIKYLKTIIFIYNNLLIAFMWPYFYDVRASLIYSLTLYWGNLKKIIFSRASNRNAVSSGISQARSYW